MEDSTDSRDRDARRTTFSPVIAIFSVRWSTATLDGAHTSTWDCRHTNSTGGAHRRCAPHGDVVADGLLARELQRARTWDILARWYTMVAEVTVFPVPGGPWMRDSGRWSTCFTADTCAGGNDSSVTEIGRKLGGQPNRALSQPTLRIVASCIHREVHQEKRGSHANTTALHPAPASGSTPAARAQKTCGGGWPSPLGPPRCGPGWCGTGTHSRMCCRWQRSAMRSAFGQSCK
jgi:hypothetical protein